MTKKKTGRKAESFTRGTPAHARSLSNHRVLRAFGLFGVVILALVSSVAFGVQWRVNNLVEKVDVSHIVAAPTKPKDAQAGKSLNILVLGSDDRSGENGELSDHASTSMRSDTAMLVHVSSNRKRVEVVSIPRDSMVKIPECTTTSGQVLPATERTMFNSAFARGWDHGGDIASAAACTINTVQENTGLTIDHFVVVDFAGFKNLVDALGGIDINIPEDMYSKKAGKLTLKAGQQTLDGTTALKLVRARTGTGWGLQIGSDLKRIERQQAVLTATIQTALHKNIITDLPKLTSFISSGFAALKMDNDLAGNMLGLATSMMGMNTDNVYFTAVPVADDPNDWGRVVWTSEASAIWASLAIDEPLDGESTIECAVGPDNGAGTGTGTSTGGAGTGEAGTGTGTDDTGTGDAVTGTTDGSNGSNAQTNCIDPADTLSTNGSTDSSMDSSTDSADQANAN